jgi:hypothetical protein
MKLNKEYFDSPFYFYLTESEGEITLYFNMSNTLTESRKDDEKISFNKKDRKKVESEIMKIKLDKKIKSKKDLKDRLSKTKSEIDELVNSDGNFSTSKIPILNPKLSPKGTIDQEVVATRQPSNVLGRGYYGRMNYWGESEEKGDDIVSEIDLSGSFGFEETEDLPGPETFKTYVKELGMDPEDAKQRTIQQGKTPDPKQHKKRLEKVPKKIKNDPNFIDRMTLVEKEKIEEDRKKGALKMVEDIVLKNKKDSKDISKKNSHVSKILSKNLELMKKLAKKEGISTEELIKILKKGE